MLIFQLRLQRWLPWLKHLESLVCHMLVPPSYGLIDLLQEPCHLVLASLLDCLPVLILQGTVLFSWGFRRGAIRISAAAVSGQSGSATAVLEKKCSVAPISSSSQAWGPESKSRCSVTHSSIL